MMKRKRVTALMLCVLMSLSSLPASALEVPAEEPFSEITSARRAVIKAATVPGNFRISRFGKLTMNRIKMEELSYREPL